MNAHLCAMTMRHKLQIMNFFSQILPSSRRPNCARSHVRTFILVSIKLVHAIHAPVPTLFITTPVSTLEKVPLLGGVSVLESSIIRNTP